MEIKYEHNQPKHITMEKKYRLIENDTTIVDGRTTLYRIEALKDFSDVKKGDKGGYVESEKNLSHEGDCWVYNSAKVYDNARVYDNAKVYDDAVVRGSAKVFRRAVVRENAMIYDKAVVFGEVIIHDNAKVYERAVLCNYAVVGGSAEVYGRARVYGNAVICGDAEVSKDADYYVSKNIWSSERYFTYTRSNKMWKVGCFHGTSEKLIEKAYKDGAVSGREYERIVRYVEAMYADLEKDSSVK